MIKRIIFSALLLLHVLPVFSQIEGIWKGQLNMPGNSLDIYFNIQQAAGSYTGTMDVPAQQAKDIKIDAIRYEPDSRAVELEINMLGMTYAGTVSGNKIEGQFSQNGFEMSMNMTRVEKVDQASAPLRPQTPVPPYAYSEEEVTFYNKKDNITITGTLTLPEHAGKNTPVVILFNGSGQQNRNSEVFGHQPFHVIADYLSNRGVIVLRYDDRGVGGTSAGENLKSATTYDFARDGQAAIDFLKSRSYRNIHLAGHSEGGLIASILGAQNPDIKSIILLASPSVRGDIILAEQTYYGGLAMGVDSSLAAANRDLMYMISKTIRSNPQIKSPQLQAEIIEYMKGSSLAAMMSGEEMEALAEQTASQYISPWLTAFMDLDPEKYLKKIKAPVLAVYGSTDVQVPLSVNGKKMKDILSVSDRNQVKVIDHVNHLLQRSETGSAAEYAVIEETVNEEVLKAIIDWIRKQS